MGDLKEKSHSGFSKEERINGVLAEFSTPGELLKVAKNVRVSGGYSRYDCYSPFPIHGMDDAMGLGQSPLGYIVAAVGTLGLAGAVFMQWWMSAVDYPLLYSGKPFFSIPAFVPISFELTVLPSAFAAVLGMLALNKLPRFHHPVFYSDRFEKKASDDGFFVVIYAWDNRFDVNEVKSFLQKEGGKNIEVIYSTEETT